MDKQLLYAQRKQWLDALRAIAIILVVYGHCVEEWDLYFIFTSPVKMPLFFVISAYLFNSRNGNQRHFFKNIVQKLIVPWLILGLFPYNSPINRFLDLVLGKVLWFMPCLIIAEIIWFYILKLSKSKFQIYLNGFVSCAVGFALHFAQGFHYAMIDTALIVQFFFLLGMTIREKEVKLTCKWQIWIPFYIGTYFILGLLDMLLWQGQALDVHKNSYFNIPLCAIMIILGCISLFTLFRMLDIKNYLLVYIGQNTLLIYIFHGFCIHLFDRVFKSYIIIPLPIYGFIQAVFAISICCVLAFCINRYIPELVGKKRI